jgi:hypothetical protein
MNIDKDTWYPYISGMDKNQRSFKGIVIKDYAPKLLLLETGDFILLENSSMIEVQ